MMATRVSRIPSSVQCPRCRKWSDATQDFQKIIDLSNIGLAIYRHTLRIPRDERLLTDQSVEITKQILIFQNTKDIKISTDECLPELEKKIGTCPHCLKTIERVLELLKNVPYINKKETRGVCDHCLIKQKKCYDCDNALKKFLNNLSSENTGKRRLSKMKHMLHNESVPVSTQKFRIAISPERPVLSDYSKEALLKMDKRRIENGESKHLLEEPSSKITLKMGIELESGLKDRNETTYQQKYKSQYLEGTLNDTEPKTFSQELLVNKNRFASKGGIVKKDYSFYFPKSTKAQPQKGLKTSSVLIKETRQKLVSKSEEEKDRKRQNKLQTEEKKNILDKKAKSHKKSADEDDEKKLERKTKHEDGNKKNLSKIRTVDDAMDTKDNIQHKRGKNIDKDQESDKDSLKLVKQQEKKIPKDGKIDKQIEKGGKYEAKGEKGRKDEAKGEKGGKDEAKGEKGSKVKNSDQSRPVKDNKFQKALKPTTEQKPKRRDSKDDHHVETVKQKSKNKQLMKIAHDELGIPKDNKSKGHDDKATEKIESESALVSGKKQIGNIKLMQSLDDMVLKLIKIKKAGETKSKMVPRGVVVDSDRRPIMTQYKESEENILVCEKIDETVSDIIIGSKICKRTSPRIDKEEGPGIFVKTPFTEINVDTTLPPTDENETKELSKDAPGTGINFALSDRSFIDKGWTVLPTHKIVRKMNIYRMRPAKPEFDWFKHNKKKKLMNYDSGEILADFDENGHGCGRWYYKNGRVALDYYDAQEKNAQHRFVIHSSGEPDDRGCPQPYTILAVFDFLGNGIVYDHTGKIRLKYNQTEGVLLDQDVGPVSYWKWHTLNDPPVIREILVDTQMPYKDEDILELGRNLGEDEPEREKDEAMLTIEFENFIKEKSLKLNQTFKPFQIRMKALKINKYFSLKVLDQRTIYIIYRDGTTNLKLNIGMILDPTEIIDTDVVDLGIVYNSLERFPACTDSLAKIQKALLYGQNFEKMRLEHERLLKIPEQSASIDKLTAAASRPMRLPLRTVPSDSSELTATLENDLILKCCTTDKVSDGLTVA